MMPMLKFWQSYNTKNVRKESFRKMNQNEPIFLNLYIRDTEKSETFVLSTTYQITIKMIAEKLLIFVEEH